MALNNLTFFEETESSSSEILFYGDWASSQKKLPKEPFLIESIKKTKKGKGYMVHTSAFVCFLYKNNKLTKMLMEAIETFCANGTGNSLYIVPISKEKDGFKIAADKTTPCNWYSNQKEYSVFPLMDLPDEYDIGQGNPFV